jgi:outer membrane protein TolC
MNLGAGVLAAVVLSALLVRPSGAATVPVPLKLDDAIALALRQNISYRQSATQIDAARAALGQAASAAGLRVSLQDTEQYQTPVATLSTPFGALPFSPTNFTSTPLVVARLVAYDGGASAAKVAQAQASLARSEAQVEQTRQDTVGAVAKAYYAAAASIAVATDAKRATRVAERHEADARLRLRAGTAARADVLQAQTDLADQRVREIDAQNQVAISQASLDRVLGVPQTKTYIPVDRLDAPVPSEDVEALVRQSREERADLSAARSAVVIAKAAVAEVKAGHRPNVTLSASDGNVQPAIERGFHNQFTIGLNAVWTIFDRGYTDAAVAQAEAGVANAELGVADLASSIELQVRQAALNVAANQARVAAARRLVQLADENLRLAQVRRQGGVSTALELQDATQRDFDARRTLVQSLVQLRTAVIDLQSYAGQLSTTNP